MTTNGYYSRKIGRVVQRAQRPGRRAAALARAGAPAVLAACVLLATGLGLQDAGMAGDGSPPLLWAAGAENGNAPALDPIEPQEVDELEELRFNATASGNGTLSFSLAGTPPSGAAIGESTGAFAWTPAEHQNGVHTITVAVSGGGGTDSQDVRVLVNEVNAHPELEAIQDQETGEASALTLVASANDTDRHPGIGAEVVAGDLKIPWSIDWTPDGTALFTERGGNLTAIENGTVGPGPVLTLDVDDRAEGGLLGLAVDPDFGKNAYIYLYQTYAGSGATTLNKVVRYTFENGTVAEDLILIDEIPGARFHDGGRIRFGPDGNLYVTTGDAQQPSLAQNKNSLAGKILRITRDGEIPAGNPFDNSSVWSWGHRNSQGIDWDGAGNMVATEHGPSGEKGRAHDEINLILRGANYGWPTIVGGESAPGMRTPLLHTGDVTWAPSGSEFYDGEAVPALAGKYLVATLLGKHLRVINLDLSEKRVLSHEALFEGEFGRLRDVQTGPDQFPYLLTSNRDGRGIPETGDDRIIKIVPVFDAASSRPANLLTYGLESAPAGASIDPDTGTLTWMPTESQDGNHTVRLAVSDGRGGTDAVEFRITVTEKDTAPVLHGIGPKGVDELQPLRFPATASDPDIVGGIPDSMTFSLAGMPPAGASMTPDGMFEWTPTESQDGNHTVRVAVSDGRGGTDEESVMITVNEVNVAPRLGGIEDPAVPELTTLSFSANVTDPDNGESHVFSLTRAPPGASMTPEGRFSWMPAESQDGRHTIEVSVADRHGATDSETFTVTVREVNVEPSLRRIGPQSGDELVRLAFDARVDDPDNNDAHAFSLSGAQPGMAIARNGTFTWMPGELQDGVHHVSVTVRDRAGESASENVTVTVREVNEGPELGPIGDLPARELEELEFTATVTDPDNGDSHEFSLSGAPRGAVINGTSGLFLWTPAEDQDGNHTVTVTVTDRGGLSDSETITVRVAEVDNVRPAPVLGSGGGSPTNLQRIAFWADFGEPVRPGSFAAGDIEASSGRATAPSSTDGQNFTFAVVGAAEGTLTVSIPENGIQDIEGNWNEESGPFSILVDRTAPVPVLATASGSPTGAESITFTATFDEDIDGRTVGAADVESSSGGVENVQLLGSDSFSFDVAGPSTGTLRVSVPAGGVQDLAGNGNAASNTYEIVIDRDEPAPSVTALTGSPTAAQAVQFRVDFDRDIDPSSFTAGDVDSSSGTVSTPAEVNSRRFTFSVNGSSDGELAVYIPAGRIQDTSDNFNIGSNTATVLVDRTGPLPQITAVTDSPTAAQVVTFEADFGEPTRAGSFSPGDVEASSGRPANVRAAGEDRFTFDVTGAGSGTLEVRIPAGRVQDTLGNGNSDSNTATIEIDRSRPVPEIAALTPSPSNAQVIEFRVDFDKEVDAGTFAAGDITASSGQPSEPVEISGRGFSFSVAGPAEGELRVSIRAGQLRDTLGNPNAASNVTAVTIDRTAPIPRVTAKTGSPTNLQEIPFAVDFGEEIDPGSFGRGGIQVVGGTVASGPDGADGRSFGFTVRPSGDGQVAASIPAGAARDPAGNGNAESGTASVIYDGTAPQVTAAYLVSPGSVAVLFSELVDAAAANGSGFSVQNRDVSSNTDPALRSGVVTLRVAGAAGGDLLSYSGAAGSIADAAGNAAAAGSWTVVEVADGAVTLPSGDLQRYELPRQVSEVEVVRNGLPPEVVTSGRLALDFSPAPTFSSADPARTTVTLTDSASNLTAPVGRVAVTVSLPAGVGAESGASWDGSFALPGPSGAGPPPAGQFAVHTKRVAFSLGADSQILLDRAVRILVPGEGGQRVFVSEGGGSPRAVTECGFADTQEAADAGLDAGEDCHTDVGRDLAIWTRHLSHWGTYHSGPRVTEPPPEPEPEQVATAEDAPTAAGGSGGGGGGGGAPEEIITDVRIYSVSWDCAAGAVVATVGPDTNQLTVRMRTSSVGERPVTEAASALLGSRTYTAAISGADQFAVVEVNLAYEGDRTITKIVNLRECAGQVSIDRYEPPQQVAPRPEPEPRELCSDGREPALRDGSRLLCLFPGTFETLSERGWDLARP